MCQWCVSEMDLILYSIFFLNVYDSFESYQINLTENVFFDSIPEQCMYYVCIIGYFKCLKIDKS